MGRNKVMAVLGAILFLAGCGAGGEESGAGRIHDNKGVYQLPGDDYATLYIDVHHNGGDIPFFRLSGQERDEGEKVSFPMVIYDEEEELASASLPVTGEVQVKGNQTYRSYYRSFKVTLDGDYKYKNQGVFLLYKCPEDVSKLTMRLGMDAYALCDDIVSTRTGFVRLYIRDRGVGKEEYEDYGLYTMAENPGGRYLRTHGLDRNGELYEVKGFDLSYEEWKKGNEGDRRKLAEYKNGSEPEKFEDMLKSIQEAEDFDAAFDTYFDRDNYLTWIAASILLGNYRAGTEDFLLYSPTDSLKWYFFPLPTDRLLLTEKESKWSTPPESYTGLGWFMESSVHYRFFQSEDNRKELKDKVEELYEVMNEDTISSMCLEYKKALKEFVGRTPDYSLLRYSLEETESRIDGIPELIEKNEELFRENINKPLPFQMKEPVFNEETGGYTISWDAAISEDEVVYHLKILGDVEGAELFRISTEELSAELPVGLEGYLYIGLTAESKKGTQVMNSYVKGEEASIWGLRYYEFLSGGGES